MTGRLSYCLLCIGSDAINLNLRCSRLRDLGWEVYSSFSAQDGLSILEREHIDAVVLDLNDKGVENALAAHHVRQRDPSLPIVMLVWNLDNLAPGATDLADAVLLKSESESVLHQRLLELLKRA
ncbi:MAG TPA: response regulator [Candidatus Sulfotelmatobacter sp.]|nr:response regulator [Candidatus Sulfotelmatobacter sp.]